MEDNNDDTLKKIAIGIVAIVMALYIAKKLGVR